MKTIAKHHNRLLKASSLTAKSILVPLDFSANSRAQLQEAIVLAGLINTELVLLYVAETNPSRSELRDCHSRALEAYLAPLATTEFTKLREDLPAGLPSRSLIRAGRPECEIVDAAQNLNVELIVLSTHSKDSRQGQLGTTAGRVASLASCPVLLVPVPEPHVPFFL